MQREKTSFLNHSRSPSADNSGRSPRVLLRASLDSGDRGESPRKKQSSDRGDNVDTRLPTVHRPKIPKSAHFASFPPLSAVMRIWGAAALICSSPWIGSALRTHEPRLKSPDSAIPDYAVEAKHESPLLATIQCEDGAPHPATLETISKRMYLRRGAKAARSSDPPAPMQTSLDTDRCAVSPRAAKLRD